MRVVFLWRDAFQTGDGVSRLLTHLLDGLPLYGIEPFVLTWKKTTPGQEAMRRKYGEQIIECYNPQPENADEADLARGWGWSPFLRHHVRFVQARISILRQITRLHPKVVVFNEFWQGDLAMLLYPHCATANIWHSHTPHASYFEPASIYNHVLDAMICINASVASTLLEHGGQEVRRKTHVIMHGVSGPGQVYPLRTFDTHIPLRIAYIGRFCQESKRVSDLAKILGALRERGVDFQVTLAGDGPDWAKTKRQFEALGLSARFVGTVAPEEVNQILMRHDALLITSNFEGGPLVLLEAMGVGCVPVVSRCSGLIAHVVDEGANGLSFEVGDVDGAADHLARLDRDRTVLGRMSRAAFQTSAGYTMDGMSQQYAELLHRLPQARRLSWSLWQSALLLLRYLAYGIGNFLRHAWPATGE